MSYSKIFITKEIKKNIAIKSTKSLPSRTW